MIDIPVLGRDAAARAASRDARDASAELRRAAREMRHAMERFPKDRRRLPGASAALADAARTMRDATRAAREVADGSPAAGAVAEAIRTELDIAAGAAADAARDAALLGLRSLGPVAARMEEAKLRVGGAVADVLDEVPGTVETIRGSAKASAKELRRAAEEAAKATARASSRASAGSAKDLRRLARESATSTKELRGSVAGLKEAVRGAGSAIDLGVVADAALPLASALGRPRRRGIGLARGTVLLVVPFLLAAPLVAVWQRRRIEAELERLRGTGATGAIGVADPAVADDLLRSEGEGYSTGVAAPTVTAASANDRPTSSAWDALSGGEVPPTVAVPDATDVSAATDVPAPFEGTDELESGLRRADEPGRDAG